METIKYVHAADLHLDASFKGLARAGNEQLATKLAEATFKALANIGRLCEQERPDFLLLAGDIYNQEDHSVRAQLRLQELFINLEKLKIPVFISYGNHDPLSSRFRAVRFPHNVMEFEADPGTAPVKKDNEIIALIHGASHATPKESRNIAKLFQRDPALDCFQIGLLHCNADGAVSEDRYAPCSVKDLIASGLDAWALGHAHKRQILAGQPFIAYSGCSQGIRPSENGIKGCLLVTARKQGNLWKCEEDFKQLGPIIWLREEIDLQGLSTLNEAMEQIQIAIQSTLAEASFCEGIIARLTLSGQTSLATELAKDGALSELFEEASLPFREDCEIWGAEIVNATRPYDQIPILDRDDLLGEIGRIGKHYEEDNESLATALKSTLLPLYGTRRYSAYLKEPDENEMKELLKKAQLICQNLLEGR